MEGKAWDSTGLRMRGIGCSNSWVPGSTGMATSDILLTPSFKSITCFGRTFHMKGANAVM